MMEKARDLMQLGVRTVEKDSSIYDAIAILAERRGSGLPVTDGSTLVGIITEKDVLQLVFQEEHLPGSVEQYMTRDVVTFDEQDDLAKVWTCLVRQSYRRVPIVREGRLTGIISRADLILYLLKHRTILFQGRTPASAGVPAFSLDRKGPH